MLNESLIVKTTAKANDYQVFCDFGLRITVLTPRLIRVESGDFTDLASFAVFNRQFEKTNMAVQKQGNEVVVETDDIVFVIDRYGKPYSACFKDTKKVEIFSRQKNLKGTRRTLDATAGPVKLDDGLITKNGAYLFCDKSMLISDEGRFVARSKNSKDYYAFAYGKDYRATIKAFYDISGATPLIPRYALGVWWSRYHAYSQQEYLDLMQKFKSDNIPLTVATIDMDWHWVKDIDKKFGVKYRGWTGYSWNTELFPDYKEFLKKLKDDNLHITVNLHPADGVYCYEDMYEDMAKAMGVNPSTKEKIDFRCGSDDFWNAYFDVLHKPYERDGVDFWWIDWQQGKKSDVEGLDPLNALNHYHYLDIARDSRMPMILSRYAGFGSHRYPLGFSGDTSITWRTFNFQPYFTANATNAAYSWWSHDIGGHHLGYRDDDLYIRWLQFGVFSPIMRLHSTAWELLGKEPWKYRKEVHDCAREWLNLRHRLIPYIFTMDYRTHEEGLALCEPMYYSYPDNENAYNVPNQYMFGSEVMVCPITTKQHKSLNMGSVNAWLPKGRWIDVFTAKAYNGDMMLELFRELDTIPVLAKEGAIIPLSSDKGNKTDNPENLEIWAFSGDGSFTLVEDNDRVDYSLHKATTKFEMSYDGDSVTFTVNKAEGDTAVIPEKRNYKVIVKDLFECSKPVVFEFTACSIYEKHTKKVSGVSRADLPDTREEVIRIMSRWQGRNVIKNNAYKCLENLRDRDDIIKALDNSKTIPKTVKNAILEAII